MDNKNEPGLFILTGSHQLSLSQAVTQSLAGRTDIIKLLPLSLSEINQVKSSMSENEYLIKGFYPRIYKDNLTPKRFYRNYFETYVQRDVRNLLNVKDLNKFERFVRLCAGRIGRCLNTSELSNEVGISNHTAEEWLSVLEASFIIFRLQPYFTNTNKRLIKSPKLYFYDVGLASYLLKIETLEHIERDPLRGHLFENLVVVDAMKERFNHGEDPNLYFYRDAARNEVDLIFQKEDGFNAIEIKPSQTFNPSFIDKIEYLRKNFGDKLLKSYVIYQGNLESTYKGTQLLSTKDLPDIFS